VRNSRSKALIITLAITATTAAFVNFSPPGLDVYRSSGHSSSDPDQSGGPPQKLVDEVRHFWARIESRRTDDGPVALLIALHQVTRSIFVSREGSGMGRMQNSTRVRLSETDMALLGSGILNPQVDPSTPFGRLHLANTQTFGQQQKPSTSNDGDAGSSHRRTPHGIQPISSYQGFEIESILLIGLSMPSLHDQPVVYLTDGLASLEDSESIPTRPLDAFEQMAVKELSDGFQDVAYEFNGLLIGGRSGRHQSTKVRMVGAIRASQSCNQCHDSKDGDLLGAFSYTLNPSKLHYSPNASSRSGRAQ
jgi:hypothetical protein